MGIWKVKDRHCASQRFSKCCRLGDCAKWFRLVSRPDCIVWLNLIGKQVSGAKQDVAVPLWLWGRGDKQQALVRREESDSRIEPLAKATLSLASDLFSSPAVFLLGDGELRGPSSTGRDSSVCLTPRYFRIAELRARSCSSVRRSLSRKSKSVVTSPASRSRSARSWFSLNFRLPRKLRRLTTSNGTVQRTKKVKKVFGRLGNAGTPRNKLPARNLASRYYRMTCYLA